MEALGLLSIRLKNGQEVPSNWFFNGVGRIVGEANWADIPVGAALTVYEGEKAVLGPFEAYHTMDEAVTMSLVDSVRGFVSRITLVENGDVARLYFTLLDSAGYPVGAFPDWVVLETEGGLSVGELEYTYGLGNGFLEDPPPGWDLTTLVRAGPGTDPGRVLVKLKDGRLVGQFVITKRASFDVDHDAMASTSEIIHDSLPAGVGANTDVNIYPRNALNELLGMDVRVELRGPDFVRIDQPEITESGHFRGKVHADFFGGEANIDVLINGKFFTSHTIEIIGPALPSSPPTVAYPDSSPDGGPDVGGSEVKPTEPGAGTSEGCTGGSDRSRGSAFFILLVMWAFLTRRRLRSIGVMLALFIPLNGCQEAAPVGPKDGGAHSVEDIVGSDVTAWSDDDAGTPDTVPASHEEPLILVPNHCDPPPELPPDSIEVEQNLKTSLMISHMTEVQQDEYRPDVMYGYGFPGLCIFERDAEGVWTHRGMFPKNNVWMGYEHVPEVAEIGFGAPLGENMVVVSARGQTPPESYVGHPTEETHGLFFLDVSDPANPTVSSHFDLYDLAGMARKDSLLYVLSFSGNLHLFDVSDLSAPEYLGFTYLMENPWRLVVEGDVAYVVDNVAGLIVLDLSVPLEPTVAETVETAGGIVDIAVTDGHLYAAVGTPGIEVFELSNPLKPSSVAVFDVGPAAVGVGSDNGLLWVANNEGILAFSLDDPSAPQWVGYEETADWALNVSAEGQKAHVSDWDYVRVMRAYPERLSPEFDPHPRELYYPSGGERTQAFTITNRGRAELVITGMKAMAKHTGEEVYEMRAERLTLQAGESTLVQVTLKEGKEALPSTLCIASNDPDEAVSWDVTLGPTSDNISGIKVGEKAPDFALPEVKSGQYHQLSDYLGAPIYLVFFSTW